MIRTAPSGRVLASVFALLSLASALPGQETTETAMPEPFTRAQSYEFTAVDRDDESRPLKFVPQSFLSWTNPVFGTTDGALFLWTDEDRPVAVMKTYTTKTGFRFEQLRSFCRDRIVASDKAGKTFWTPDLAAEPMKLLPDAPPPAATATARLLQMKRLHRKFTVTGDVVNAGGIQELRVFPRPLYRYKTDDVIDGGVLAFVQGTGPDVLLLLEAREVEGQAKWHYALGSVGIFAADADYANERVWSEPRRTAANTRPNDLYDGRRLPK